MSTTEPVDALETADAYPKYNDYEGSGVDWLGDIPAHWNTAKLKFLCDRSAVYGANRSADEYTQDGVRFLRTTDIDESGALTSEGVYIDPDSVENYMLENGDLLLSRSGTVGRSFIYSSTKHEPCAYAGYLVRFVLDREKLNPEYAFYFTKTGNFYEWLRSNSIESTIGNVSGDKYANMPTVVPPPDEQRAIATFLDRKTERIDALIEKKERLIDLLEEKRTALISRVVTKGLDRDAEMQDSGVDWLGEIPEHWETVPFGYYCDIMAGKVDPESDRHKDRILISPDHVEQNTGNLFELETADDQGASSQKYVAKPGDLIYSKIRPELNKVCISEGNWLCSADMYPLRIRKGYDAQYLKYLMLSRQFMHLMVSNSMRVAMPKVNRDTLNAARIPLPSLPEQREIASHLEQKTSRIDVLKSQIEKAIDRLKEYRTALISAAVTGQIDVREEVPAAPAE